MSLVSDGRVVLQFYFPLDASLPKEASIYWRPATLAQGMDTWYANVTQAADRTKIVHEQVTFPNEMWIVCSRDSGELLAVYTTTDAPFQQCVITRSSMKAASMAGARNVNMEPNANLDQAKDRSVRETPNEAELTLDLSSFRRVLISGLSGVRRDSKPH